MIQVAIVCAKGGQFGRPPCGALCETLAPDLVEEWADRVLREHGWYVDPDTDACYCPRHNPADGGRIARIVAGPGYMPLNETGWEARLPDGFSGEVQIEIRPALARTADAPEEE